MPEVRRFFGIIIRMYFDEHVPPHFHAIYGESMKPRSGLILLKCWPANSRIVLPQW